MQHQTRRV